MGSLPARLVGIAVATVAALSGPAVGDTRGLTLAEAVERALQDGVEARIARLEAASADDAAGAARSIYWPRALVESQAGWSNRQDDTLDAVDGQGDLKRYPLSALGSNSAWLSVYVEQIVFDLRQWRGVERSELEAEVATVTEAEQRDRIALVALERYLTVLRVQTLTALAVQQVERAERLDRQAALLLDSGRALAAERAQVGLHLDEARVHLQTRRAEVESARLALAETIGDSDGGSGEMRLVPDSVPSATAPGEDAAVANEALRAAPELRVLELRRRMEDLSVAAARAERLPTLSVRGGYFHYGTKRFDSFEDEVAVGVDLRVPVFNGFRTTNVIAGASKAAEAARLRYDAVRDAKRARVRELVRVLAALEQQVAIARRRADITRERQRLADLSLQTQRGTLAQALAVRGELARDTTAAVDLGTDRVITWAKLQRETGRLADVLTGVAASQP